MERLVGYRMPDGKECRHIGVEWLETLNWAWVVVELDWKNKARISAIVEQLEKQDSFVGHFVAGSFLDGYKLVGHFSDRRTADKVAALIAKNVYHALHDEGFIRYVWS